MSNNPNEVVPLNPTPAASFSLTPKSLDEAMKFSEMIAASDICPKDFKGKAGNVLVAVQMGSELGLPPMQAIQNIAVINGRPSIWGDATPALAKAHPKFEYMDESFDESTFTAICKIKRKGEPEQIKKFGQADAQQAGLWGKPGPWQNYPKRMCQMRARAFAIRDVFPDALKGIQVAEEVLDYEIKDMGDADRVNDQPEPTVIPGYPQEQFEKNYPVWEQYILSGKVTVDDMIAKIETKGTLTDQQKQKIKSVTAEQGATE